MTNLVLHCKSKRTGDSKRLNSDLDLKSSLKFVDKKMFKRYIEKKDKICLDTSLMHFYR